MNATPRPRRVLHHPHRGRIPLTPRPGPAELAFERRARRPFGAGILTFEEEFADALARLHGRPVPLIEACQVLDRLDAMARRCNPGLAEGGAR